MINVKGLTKWFGSTLAVDNITFQVPAGQVLGFLGPNGAGKTTTMRILTGYLPADEGSAQVAGYDIYSQSLEVRKRIGYLPENAPLYLDMDVPDFLHFIASIRKIPTSDIGKATKRIVDLCGLKLVMHKKIGELSKGYRQRVGLAQAMIHNPDILVLDEPTSGLDPNQIVEIRELIKELGREKTVILSTHILPEVTATCDRILIIDEGKLIADGTPQELTKKSAEQATLWVTVKSEADIPVDSFTRFNGVHSVFRDMEFRQGSLFQRFGLKLESNVNPAADIFRYAVESGWILTELHLETATLEEVFTQLTK
ncbi:MAG: ATP-binding cassette domain-containing protein [bacterium]